MWSKATVSISELQSACRSGNQWSDHVAFALTSFRSVALTCFRSVAGPRTSAQWPPCLRARFLVSLLVFNEAVIEGIKERAWQWGQLSRTVIESGEHVWFGFHSRTLFRRSCNPIAVNFSFSSETGAASFHIGCGAMWSKATVSISELQNACRSGRQWSDHLPCALLTISFPCFEGLRPTLQWPLCQRVRFLVSLPDFTVAVFDGNSRAWQLRTMRTDTSNYSN